VDIYSNLVYGVAGCNCGGAAGIEISGDAADGTVNVVGNTSDDAQFASSGLEVNDGDPGSLTVNIFDNIISNASEAVVDLPSIADPGLTITHDFNDAYDPGDPADYGDYPPGPNSDAEDPLFVNAAAADYRLQSGSPQKQQGLVCPPGGQSATDLAGNDRVERVLGQGAFVTPGAFGFASSPPEGSLFLGSELADDLDGGAVSEVFCTYGGDDTVTGGGGGDVVFGGLGGDEVGGDAGDDYIYGEAGQDVIDGGTGSDYLSGGDDFDVIEAHDGIEGNDVLDGGGGVDSCNPDPSDLFTNC
jgi:Ca2+-binding RTX toxin-like protein